MLTAARRAMVTGGPAPAFDFGGGSLPAGATLTRASSATYWDSAGVLQTAAIDAARFDHDPVTHVLRGILIEPERTNLLVRSGTLDHADWLPSEMTVTADAIAGPDGNAVVDKIIPSAVNTAHLMRQTGLASTVACLSFFGKAGEESIISAWLDGANIGAGFNLSTGLEDAISAAMNVVMTAVGNGFYRCSCHRAAQATTTAHFYGRKGSGFAGNGSDGLYLWGAQLEEGASPTSYIPTTDASATRSADALTLDWSSKRVSDGVRPIRYLFDDGSTQDATVTIASGLALVPTNLNRPCLRRVFLV